MKKENLSFNIKNNNMKQENSNVVKFRRPPFILWWPENENDRKGHYLSHKNHIKSCLICAHHLVNNNEEKRGGKKSLIDGNCDYYYYKTKQSKSLKQQANLLERKQVKTLLPKLASSYVLNLKFPLSSSTTTTILRRNPFLFLIHIALVLVLITNLLTSQIKFISSSQISSPATSSLSLQRLTTTVYDNSSLLADSDKATGE